MRPEGGNEMSKNATGAPRGRAATKPARRTSAAPKAQAPRKTATKAKAQAQKKSGGAEAAVVRTSQAPTVQAPRKPSKTGLKVALTLLLMAVIGGAAGVGTWSAFSSTTENTGNTFAAGTVIIGDSDGGGTSPMFTFANAKPGQADTPSCITVTYTGSLSSSVRLYGTTGGTGLDQYLDLVVTRGSGAGAFDDCVGFVADSVGVVYSGLLQGFADGYDAPGIDDGEVWTNPESHQYKFEVTLRSDAPNAAQGLNATQVFTWEARNN
jgi:predicted ribosomally synthesized peptide with SipW-like signal peptide